MEELAVHKNELFQALGENSAGYLNLLRLWFKCGLSKLEFDTEARKLLSRETIAFHNRFLVALFSRCHSLASRTSPVDSSPHHTSSSSPSIVSEIRLHSPEPKKVLLPRLMSDQFSMTITPSYAKDNSSDDQRPRSKKLKVKQPKQLQRLIRLPDDQRFLSADHREYTQKHLRSISGMGKNSRLYFCSSEKMLPDHFMSHLRFFVNVWEYGVDGITDEAILLTNLAIRDFIKNIITSVLMFKSNNPIRSRHRCFQTDSPSDVNHFLINAQPLIKYPIDSGIVDLNDSGDYAPEIKPSREVAVHEALLKIACAPQHRHKNSNQGRIRLAHLHHALRLYRNTIPTHSVYTTNMERIQMRLGDEETTDEDDHF